MNELAETLLVSVVVPNRNGMELLGACLESVSSQTHKNHETIVVDNDSSDGSCELVRTSYPNATLIQFEHNAGFAEATNRGIKASNGDAFLLLNNDALLERECLEELLRTACGDESIGMVTPKVLYAGARDVLNSTGFLLYRDFSAVLRGINSVDNDQYPATEEVFGPPGVAALYKKRVLDQVGLLDETYFAYGEDLDLAWRARRGGWKCMYAPGAVVYHHRSATSVVHSPFKAYYTERNRIWNVFKHLPPRLIAASVYFTVKRYARTLVHVAGGRGQKATNIRKNSKMALVGAVLRAWIDAALGLPRVLRERRRVLVKSTVDSREIARWFDKFGATVEEIVEN